MKVKLNPRNFFLSKILGYFTILVFLLLGLLKVDSLWEKIFTFFIFSSLLQLLQGEMSRPSGLEVSRSSAEGRVGKQAYEAVPSKGNAFRRRGKPRASVLGEASFAFLIFLKEKRFWKKQVNFYLLLLVSYFLLIAFFRGQDVREKIAQEPLAETYFSDEILFLKTYFLMKKGVSYYSAFAQAVIGHGMMNEIPREIWGWRWPTVFYFWKYLTPNALWLQILFLGVACLVLISAFSIAQNFLDKSFALLSPFLLIPYFLESAANTYFLLTEWWGVMFFLGGMAFFLKQKKTLSIILFSLAILTRELLLIPLLTFLIISLILKKDSKQLIFPLVIFFFVLTLHYLKILQFLSFFPQLSPGSRLHQPSFLLLQKEFAFNSREYLLVDYRVLIWFFFFSLIGLI